jgi:hypothetical protein
VDGSLYHAYYAKHGLEANYLLKNEGLMMLGQRMPPKLFKDAKRIALVVDAEWLKKIASWRRHQSDPMPTTSDAIRQLVEIAFEAIASGYKPKKPKG